ncbi:uncharacterized protein LOC105420214 [Amborella trichopoda]|uniref:uncharacterized protein LOC105420214 n=1 Tax=Amborella trichopoda TaxID=13333 RepID=UPI0005D38851|nr:uncharacterized protein LOC105420214 [Amborella trichopoda]|eukprot:XP_011621262.1 uncharacterized protein LOC105420214 [Amborella trichopoda]
MHGSSLAGSYWVASKIKNCLNDIPNLTPGYVINDVQRDHSVTLSYHQAWQVKEVIQRINDSSHMKAYNDLTKPLMGLDETFLKGRYRWILLATIGIDVNENIFFRKYAVVESENTPSWIWFLKLLNEQFQEMPDLPALSIVSDRQKRLQVAIEKVFPTNEQGYCMCHLTDNFKKKFRNLALTRLYWKAARAITVSSFDEYMSKINSENAEAYDWIVKQHPKTWVNTYFQGCRYNDLT